MLLAFDVGNTNIVLGAFQERELIQSWRIETDNGKTADEFGMIISQFFAYEGLSLKDIEDVIISTVVPSMLYTLQHLSMKYFNRRAIVIEPGVKTGLKIKYDNPKQVGADRIVNAVAALAKYEIRSVAMPKAPRITINAPIAYSARRRNCRILYIPVFISFLSYCQRSPCGAHGSAYPRRGCSRFTGSFSMPYHGLARNRKNCFSPDMPIGMFV